MNLHRIILKIWCSQFDTKRQNLRLSLYSCKTKNLQIWEEFVGRPPYTKFEAGYLGEYSMRNSVFEKIHVPALIWVWVFQSMYWVVANCIAKHLGGQFSRKLTGIMNFPRTSASFTCCQKIYDEIIAECVKVNRSFMLKCKFSLNVSEYNIQMFSLPRMG